MTLTVYHAHKQYIQIPGDTLTEYMTDWLHDQLTIWTTTGPPDWPVIGLTEWQYAANQSLLTLIEKYISSQFNILCWNLMVM